MNSTKHLHLSENIKRILNNLLLKSEISLVGNVKLLRASEARMIDANYVEIFMVSSNMKDTQIACGQLNKHTGYIRHLLAKNIRFKRVPNLTFISDPLPLESEKIDNALRKLHTS